jgi:hypothetical protein
MEVGTPNSRAAGEARLIFIALAPLGRSRARLPRLGRAGRPIVHMRVDLRRLEKYRPMV